MLEGELHESHEREVNQKKMFESMMQAFQESSGGGQSKRQEELLNTTNSSIAREVEGLHKEFVDQLQAKVRELESHLESKIQTIDDLKKNSLEAEEAFSKELQQLRDVKQDKETLAGRLERKLEE